MSVAFQSKVLTEHADAYGYFIKIASFSGFSMWTVVFLQSVLLSWLILQVVKLLLGAHRFAAKGLMIILVLSLFTGLSWTASQVMPDIFTPIAFLSLFLILFSDVNRITRILLYLVFALSLSMHLSHIILFSLVLLFIIFPGRMLFAESMTKGKSIVVLALLAITICSVYPMRHPLNKSKYITFMGAMVEQGIAQKYLHEYCGAKSYVMCRYKDSLDNYNGLQFLFNPKSPFNRLGGWAKDSELNNEFRDIVIGTLTSPKYIGLHITASLKQTAAQLTTFDICDGNWSFNDTNGIIYPLILKYVPGEAKSYYQARQSQVNFAGVGFLKILYRIVEGISVILLVIGLVRFRGLYAGLYKVAAWLFILIVLLNDWDLSTFSSVTDRYGCRIAWLIPFLAILGLFKWFDAKKNNQAFSA
jgi:hypothetical protein